MSTIKQLDNADSVADETAKTSEQVESPEAAAAAAAASKRDHQHQNNNNQSDA